MHKELADTIYDHYKDTCSIVGEATKRRDRLMLYVLIVIGFFAFQSIFPDTSSIALNDFIRFKFGLSLKLDLSAIGSLIWSLLLILTLRYFQVAIFVERQYSYLHKIEDRFNKELSEDLITREGKSYLSDYPCFSNWMWMLYTVIFPVLLFIIITIEITYELKTVFVNGWSLGLALDTTAFILLAISITLYLYVLHKKEK